MKQHLLISTTLTLMLLSCNQHHYPDKGTSPPLQGLQSGYESAIEVILPSRQPLDYPNLHHILHLSENIISGGEPVGEAGLRRLAEMGVKTILSVDGKAPDAETAVKMGIRYVHIPIQYRGITEKEMLRLVKTFRELEGPFYIHCYHGKHRGPACAALGRIVRDGVLRKQALAEMRQWARTSKNYEGLYYSIAANPIPSEALTQNCQWDFPPVHPVKGIRQAMVQLSRPYDHLNYLKQRNWNTDPEHPDIDAANEIEKLVLAMTQLLAEVTESDSPDDFKLWMKESVLEVTQLKNNLSLHREYGDATSSLKAHQNLEHLSQLCIQCHGSYRNL